MANKYAVASGLWSSTSTWSDSDGGSGGATVPANNDVVYICAGVTVTMDADQSGFADGLGGLTIRGGAPPGMLEFHDGTSGFLKVKTACSIAGTTSTNRGRLLANSNGTWGGTSPLAFAYKAIIHLAGTAKINAANLDIALYCTDPTIKYAEIKGKQQSGWVGSAANDTLTFTSHGLANYTPVYLTVSGGSLPAPLQENKIYYTTAVTTNTIKLQTNCYSIAFGIIDLTTDGSGTISVWSPFTNTSTGVLAVNTDVTGDSQWATTADHNRVALIDGIASTIYPDSQTSTLSSISSTSITLGNNVDSTIDSKSRIYLLSRNVSIRTYTTINTTYIIDYGLTATHGGIFQCEIGSFGTTSTSAVGYFIYYGVGHVISGGCYWGCSGATYYASNVTVSNAVFAGGSVSAVTVGIRTMSGTLSVDSNTHFAGLCYGLHTISSGEINAKFFGCGTAAISANTNNGVVTFTSTCEMYGCGNVVDNYNTYNAKILFGAKVYRSITNVFGTVYWLETTSTFYAEQCSLVFNGTIYRGQISGECKDCGQIFYTSFNAPIPSQFVIKDDFYAYQLYKFVYTGVNFGGIFSGNIGYDRDGNCPITPVTAFDIRGGTRSIQCRNLKYATTSLISNNASNDDQFSLTSEHDNQILNTHIKYTMYGTSTKISANGSGSNPSQRSGGSAYIFQVVPNSEASPAYALRKFEILKTAIWLTTGAKTLRIYVQSDFATLPAEELEFTAQYFDNATIPSTAVVTSDESITTRTSQSDWSQYVEVSFTQQQEGWVRLELWLLGYESGKTVWVDPKVVIS